MRCFRNRFNQINVVAKLFDNYKVKKDSTNNNTPHKLIQDLTELERNKDIYNYQVSHIWSRTKDIFLFEGRGISVICQDYGPLYRS